MTNPTPHEEAAALEIVRALVRKQKEEAAAKKDSYFNAVSNPAHVPTGFSDLSSFFGDPASGKNQKELTKWTRVVREYDMVEARLRRLHENAKRKAKKMPMSHRIAGGTRQGNLG